MAKFIEVRDFVQDRPLLISTDNIFVILDDFDKTLIISNIGFHYKCKESYEEIKAMLGVGNETKLA